MSMHQDLIEEVYNNISFRSEFISYAKLCSMFKAEQDAPPAPNPEGMNFITYNDLLTAEVKVKSDSVSVIKNKRGMSLLYSSLSRALSILYQLDAEETRQLISDVADRYSQNLER